MRRPGLEVVAATCIALGATGCGGESTGGASARESAEGGALATDGGVRADSGRADGGRRVNDSCEGVCCPTAPECYSNPALGKDAPGAECLATQDNTGTRRIQLRQQWIRDTRYYGSSGIVYGVLAGRTELPWNACNQGYSYYGSGGHIQLIELNLEDADPDQHVAHLGHARFVPPSGLTDVLTNGLCYGQESYAGDPAYRLGPDEMTPSGDWVAGVPRPMPLQDAAGNSTPWTVRPARAKRLTADFTLPADRARLLAMLDENSPANISKDGFDGVFYFDDDTGRFHGFSAMSWTVVYDRDGATHLSIPLREAETELWLNDPSSPNCVGAYRADALDPNAPNPCTSTAVSNPPWGCKDDTCPVGEAPATSKGYYLITELEQIYSPDVTVTLCVSYPRRRRWRRKGSGTRTPRAAAARSGTRRPPTTRASHPVTGAPRRTARVRTRATTPGRLPRSMRTQERRSRWTRRQASPRTASSERSGRNTGNGA